MRWRTFSIRALCLLTLAAALFSAGYRLGSQHRRTVPFNKLIDLIEATIAPQSWDHVAGVGAIADIDNGCRLYVAGDPFSLQPETMTPPAIQYEITIAWSADEQAFIAEVPELPGCTADGKTYQEALANIEVVVHEWIEVAADLGRPIPTSRGPGG